MKTYLKMVAVVCVSVGIIFSGAVMADDSGSSEPRDTEEQRPRGDRPPREDRQFTDEQKATVASILSQYDASSLTAENAKAINNAFRDAGFRAGPGLRDAIEAAGFDPETISRLDPPPCGKKKRRSDRD